MIAGAAILVIFVFLSIFYIDSFTGIFAKFSDAFRQIKNDTKPATATMDDGDKAAKDLHAPHNLPENSTATIAAVGDVMMHEGQIWSGYDSKTGRYNYFEFFQEVKGEISSADIAVANLETTLGGRERKFTGYPRFNSPDELADALKEAGFDVIFTSNNHCLDRGEEGLVRTLEVLGKRGLSAVGTSRAAGERTGAIIKEINGIKIAFLAYTYGTNGNPIPKDKPYLVNLIDEDTILKDMTKAGKSADVLVVYLHFGQEYQRVASEQQRELARRLLQKGAHVVLGSHPHVTQPGEWVSVLGPEGEKLERYVAYSLGNFVSAQRFPHTDEGMILKITLEKDLLKNRINVKTIIQIPTWVDKFKRDGRMRYVVRLGEKPDAHKN
ncbi:MAG TPA: CapA family protein [Thermoanaerobacterales bacterium]|nr:CapA family protein [Thermoanaerobacterales bacterium]